MGKQKHQGRAGKAQKTEMHIPNGNRIIDDSEKTDDHGIFGAPGHQDGGDKYQKADEPQQSHGEPLQGITLGRQPVRLGFMNFIEGSAAIHGAPSTIVRPEKQMIRVVPHDVYQYNARYP